MIYVEEFAKMSLSSKQQFEIVAGSEEKWKTIFSKKIVGKATFVYGVYCYNQAIPTLHEPSKLYGIVSNGMVYIVNKSDLSVNSETQLPENSCRLDDKMNELNNRLALGFSEFFESLAVRELTEDEKDTACKAVRATIFSDSKKSIVPIIRESILLDYQMTAEFLCGVLDFNEYKNRKFEESKEYYVTLKSINTETERLAKEQYNVQDWELKMIRALNNSEAQFLHVEFELNGLKEVGKMGREQLISCLKNGDFISYYYFATMKEGERLIKSIGAERWSDKRENLTCEHISKIIFRKNVIYSK